MKLIDIALYVVYIGIYSIVVPIGLGLFYFKNLSKTLKIFLYGLIAVLFLDLALLLFDARAANTFYYLFSALDVFIYTWVFSRVIKSAVARRSILWIGGGMMSLLFVDAIFISGITNNGFSNALVKLYIALMAIYYLSKLMLEDVSTNLSKEPFLWICIGVIAFYLVGFFDIFRNPVMNHSQNLYLQYYMFWSIMTITMHLCYAKAFKVVQSK